MYCSNHITGIRKINAKNPQVLKLQTLYIDLLFNHVMGFLDFVFLLLA